MCVCETGGLEDTLIFNKEERERVNEMMGWVTSLPLSHLAVNAHKLSLTFLTVLQMHWNNIMASYSLTHTFMHLTNKENELKNVNCEVQVYKCKEVK